MIKKPLLLFDLGGTKTRIAIAHNFKTFENPVIYKTPQNYDQALSLLVKTARELANSQKFELVVGGLPGYISPEGKLHIWRNLSSWNGKFIKKDLVNRLHSPVHLLNDAALVGLGEAVYGSGKNYNIVAYLTLSTGINGALILNQKIGSNARGWEIGHQIINIKNNQNFERLVSGADLALKHGDPSKIKSKTWQEITKFICIGLNNTILHWSPEVVVLGGGLMESLKIKDIKSELSKILDIYPKLPLIKKANLGDIGGLYGALHYAKTLQKTVKF